MRELLLASVVLTGATVFVAASLGSSPAYGYACDRVNCCVNYSSSDESGATARHINVFISKDFHEDISTGTPETDDDTMTATQARHTIKTAAEIWNLEACGQALVYRGWIDTDSPGVACNSVSGRPAVFVHVLERDANEQHDAEVGEILGCQMVRLTVFNKEGASGDDIDWEIGSQTSDGRSLLNVLVHEFGHVLELGHPTSTDSPCNAVMDGACGDADFGNPYNCILAWTDKGVRDGAILYTYFRYDEANYEVEFYPSGSDVAVWKRGTSNTVSAPSAAFFANQYWLAWKEATYPAKVSYVSNDSGYWGWNSTHYEQEGWLFEPPTFHYRSGDESALVWTVAD